MEQQHSVIYDSYAKRDGFMVTTFPAFAPPPCFTVQKRPLTSWLTALASGMLVAMYL